jgi:hypothetical protein
MSGNQVAGFLCTKFQQVLTTAGHGSPLHLLRKVKKRTMVSAQVFYSGTKRWWDPQTEGPLCLRLSYPPALSLAKVLILAVLYGEAVIKASRLTPSWISPFLLRRHLPAYVIQVPHQSPLHLALHDGEVTDLTQPPDEYHSHLRWDSTLIRPLLYAIDRVRCLLHLQASSFHGFL